MLWLLAVAFAGDAAEIEELAEQIRTFETHLEAAKGWYATTGPERMAEAETLRASLEADAVELRAITKKLHILEGRARNDNKKKDLAAVEAIRADISSQRQRRNVTVKVLRGSLALGQLETDPRALSEANTRLSSAAKEWTDGPTDVWLTPFLDAAVQAEKWSIVQGAAAYCVVTCADSAAAAEILEKVPPDTRPDARWTAATTAAEASLEQK